MTLHGTTPSDYVEHVDTLIVGGGITGLSAAYALAKAGRKPVLIEQDSVGSGNTGRSGGILTLSVEADMSDMKRQDARFFIDSHRALLHLIRQERIRCGLRKTGAAYLALSELDVARLRNERRDIPGSRLVVNPQGLPGNPRAALLEPEAYRVDPVRLAVGLKSVASKLGADVREGVALHRTRGCIAHTSRGRIAFQTLIDTRGTGWDVLTVTTDAAVVRMPRGALRGLHGRAFWTCVDFEYAYGVPLSSTTILFGGPVRLGIHAKPDMKRLNSWIRQLLPGGRIDRTWCGQIRITPSTLPIIERKGHRIRVAAVCGLCAGHAAGIRAARCALGKDAQLRPSRWPYPLLLLPGAKTIGSWWLRMRSPLG